MTDIERAREYAALDSENRGFYNHAVMLRAGERDYESCFQIALLAIQSERERAKVMVDALSELEASTSEYLTTGSDRSGIEAMINAMRRDVQHARKALASWEAGNG